MPLGVPQAQGTNPDRDRNCLFIHTLWHVEGQGGIRGIHVNGLFVCHFNSVWGWTTWSFSKRFQSKCGHSQDGQYWILAWQVKWLPQSATDPLTGRWVHSGESQDAPVVGIERIQGTPWSAEGGGTTSSCNSFQHSSNRCARCLSFWETAQGVHALDTWICFSKLCLFSTCRMELSVKYLLYDIKKETCDNLKNYGKPSRATWQELNKYKVHILGAQIWPENPSIKQRKYKIKYNRSPGNKMIDPCPKMSSQSHLYCHCNNHDCEDQSAKCPVSKHLAISKQRCVFSH